MSFLPADTLRLTRRCALSVLRCFCRKVHGVIQGPLWFKRPENNVYEEELNLFAPGYLRFRRGELKKPPEFLISFAQRMTPFPVRMGEEVEMLQKKDKQVKSTARRLRRYFNRVLERGDMARVLTVDSRRILDDEVKEAFIRICARLQLERDPLKRKNAGGMLTYIAYCMGRLDSLQHQLSESTVRRFLSDLRPQIKVAHGRVCAPERVAAAYGERWVAFYEALVDAAGKLECTVEQMMEWMVNMDETAGKGCCVLLCCCVRALRPCTEYLTSVLCCCAVFAGNQVQTHMTKVLQVVGEMASCRSGGLYAFRSVKHTTCVATVSAHGPVGKPTFIVATGRSQGAGRRRGRGNARNGWLCERLPREFRDAKYKEDEVTVFQQENGSMTCHIFELWVEHVLIPGVIKMRADRGAPEDQRVFLLMDGARSHKVESVLAMLEANHIVVVKLPPHSTHFLQPLVSSA